MIPASLNNSSVFETVKPIIRLEMMMLTKKKKMTEIAWRTPFDVVGEVDHKKLSAKSNSPSIIVNTLMNDVNGSEKTPNLMQKFSCILIKAKN